MENKKHHLIIIGMQIVFLIGIFLVLYLLYPKANVNVNGNVVGFESVNAEYIIISENSDFSNPGYINFSEFKFQTFDLKPGKYYWKASNGIIKGFEKEFEIKSEIGLKIEGEGDNKTLVNIGNVKVNVTKEDGVLVGHIILEPDESEKIENKGEYVGREE